MDDIGVMRNRASGQEGDAPSDTHAEAGADAKRLAFEPPLVLWSEPFQPVAYGMACAKQAGQSFICDANPNLS